MVYLLYVPPLGFIYLKLTITVDHAIIELLEHTDNESILISVAVK